MKTPKLPKAVRCGLTLAAFVCLSASPALAAGPKAYRFTTTVGSSSVLTIDHPAFNGKPTLKPIITQNWIGVYNPHPTGVQYNAASGRWQIVNEDGANIPANSRFNLLLAPGTKTHLCSAANTYFDTSFFQTSKGKPNALFLATHIVNPVAGIPGSNSTNQVGVYYTGGSGAPYSAKWSIYNEDGSQPGTFGYHVVDVTNLKAGGVPVSFLFTTSGANTVSQISTITNPLTDNKPNAVVFVEHVYTPASPTIVNEELGVYFEANKWKIFTEDTSAMPLNAAFVVTVIPAVSP